MTWKNGQKTEHETSVIYERCPQTPISGPSTTCTTRRNASEIERIWVGGRKKDQRVARSETETSVQGTRTFLQRWERGGDINLPS